MIQFMVNLLTCQLTDAPTHRHKKSTRNELTHTCG